MIVLPFEGVELPKRWFCVSHNVTDWQGSTQFLLSMGGLVTLTQETQWWVIKFFMGAVHLNQAFKK